MSAWAGTLVFSGALFIEVYGASSRMTGLMLAIVALAYLGGNALGGRMRHDCLRRALARWNVAAAASVALTWVITPNALITLAFFSFAAAVVGARTVVGTTYGFASSASASSNWSRPSGDHPRRLSCRLLRRRRSARCRRPLGDRHRIGTALPGRHRATPFGIGGTLSTQRRVHSTRLDALRAKGRKTPPGLHRAPVTFAVATREAANQARCSATRVKGPSHKRARGPLEGATLRQPVQCRRETVSRTGFRGDSEPGCCPGERRFSAVISRPRQYPEELLERGVRLALESDRPIAHVADDLGIHRETLRKRVRQAEADQGLRPDLPTSEEREEIKRLRQENFELRRANDISYLRCWDGLVFFAFVLDAYSRMIVGWQLAGHMRTDLVLDALRMALIAAGPAPTSS